MRPFSTLVAILGCLLGGAGCYRPKIANGAFSCAISHVCPTGFDCIGGFCVRPGTAVDVDLGGLLGDLAMSMDLGAPGDLAAEPDLIKPVDVFGGELGPLDLTGKVSPIVFDAITGRIVDGEANELVAAGAPGFHRIEQPGGPTVSAWSFSTLTVPSGTTVVTSSSSGNVAAVFACSDNATIAGTIDTRGFGALGGQPGSAGDSGAPGFSGGGSGGAASSIGPGGGGGGHLATGTMGSGSGAGPGGASYGTGDVMPMYVGSGGGGGGALAGNGTGGGGGSGGGAVAILALQTLTVSGQILVNGNPGKSAFAGSSGAAGGGGGGSGGSIILSGKTLTLDSGHHLEAKGGGGGAGVNTGQSGGSGSDGRIWIAGQTVNVTGGVVDATPTEVQAVGSYVTAFPR